MDQLPASQNTNPATVQTKIVAVFSKAQRDVLGELFTSIKEEAEVHGAQIKIDVPNELDICYIPGQLQKDFFLLNSTSLNISWNINLNDVRSTPQGYLIASIIYSPSLLSQFRLYFFTLTSHACMDILNRCSTPMK